MSHDHPVAVLSVASTSADGMIIVSTWEITAPAAAGLRAEMARRLGEPVSALVPEELLIPLSESSDVITTE